MPLSSTDTFCLLAMISESEIFHGYSSVNSFGRSRHLWIVDSNCLYLKQKTKVHVQFKTTTICLYTTGNGSHIFSSEPFSKTGYWLGVCHCWFHLHGHIRAARTKNRELQNEKFLPIAGLELTTSESQV